MNSVSSMPVGKEFEQELIRIADWWCEHTVDNIHGGFFGCVDSQAMPVPNADKGIILNTRILWFFSELAHFRGDEVYLAMAHRAFKYTLDHFHDPIHGGVYWELDAKGGVINDKKQTYAQAFAVYALSAYYRVSGDSQAMCLAKEYFNLLEKRAHDPVHHGYLEAFSREWTEVGDMRLSDKDANHPKTMNTHLHVLEAYTALYAVNPQPEHEQALRRLIHYLRHYFIDVESGHLKLFLCARWDDQSQAYSYGHDIECSWLLWEAAEVLGDRSLMQELQPMVVHMADVCLREAMGARGEVYDEYHFQSGEQQRISGWWVQAEAMVGFLNAYQLSGDPRFQRAFTQVWAFVQQEHLDLHYGEWHWSPASNPIPGEPTYKAGFWKAPYHNGRAMMEIVRRLQILNEPRPISNNEFCDLS